VDCGRGLAEASSPAGPCAFSRRSSSIRARIAAKSSAARGLVTSPPSAFFSWLSAWRYYTGAGQRRALKDIPNVPVEGAERIEGWSGPVSRSRQTIIQPGDSANYNCSVVNFSQGCTTGWHTHTCDQILVVTSGSGMVATEHEKREINVGDVVHIKAGERHWHGAKADTTMGHITITLAGGQATFG